jgi:hypothetical protein
MYCIEFLLSFYKAAIRQVPFAKIMQSIRARAYQEDPETADTFAAYCFYGDPIARAKKSPLV